MVKIQNIPKSVQQSLRSARNKYYADFSEESLKEKPKKLWADIKHLTKDDPGVSGLKIDEDIITDDKGKAEILNDHFTSVFTEEDLSAVPDMGVDPKPCVGALKRLSTRKPCKRCYSAHHRIGSNFPHRHNLVKYW